MQEDPSVQTTYGCLQIPLFLVGTVVFGFLLSCLFYKPEDIDFDTFVHMSGVVGATLIVIFRLPRKAKSPPRHLKSAQDDGTHDGTSGD